MQLKGMTTPSILVPPPPGKLANLLEVPLPLQTGTTQQSAKQDLTLGAALLPDSSISSCSPSNSMPRPNNVGSITGNIVARGKPCSTTLNPSNFGDVATKMMATFSSIKP